MYLYTAVPAINSDAQDETVELQVPGDSQNVQLHHQVQAEDVVVTPEAARDDDVVRVDVDFTLPSRSLVLGSIFCVTPEDPPTPVAPPVAAAVQSIPIAPHAPQTGAGAPQATEVLESVAAPQAAEVPHAAATTLADSDAIPVPASTAVKNVEGIDVEPVAWALPANSGK